jgi:hypothetical protein
METPYFTKDLMGILGVTSTETIRVGIKKGKIPPPDVRISQKTRYWHESSLIKAGLITKGKAR